MRNQTATTERHAINPLVGVLTMSGPQADEANTVTEEFKQARASGGDAANHAAASSGAGVSNVSVANPGSGSAGAASVASGRRH